MVDRKAPRQISTVEGLDFSEFSERINEVTVSYKPSKSGKIFKFKVWYHPSRFNDLSMRRAMKVRFTGDAAPQNGASDDEDQYDSVAYMNDTIVDVVEKWDIYDGPPEESNRIEPEDIIEKLELNLKSEILRTIQEDMRPGEARRQR